MSEGYIPLPVPARHYERMVTVLGDLMAQEKGGTATDSTTVSAAKAPLKYTPTGRVMAASRPRKDWSPAEIAELRDIVNSRPVLAALIELLAATPGESVFMTDYEKVSGYNRRQLRSALAGMTQSIGKRFERGNWPFKTDFNLNDSGEASYVMTPEIAAMWTTA